MKEEIVVELTHKKVGKLIGLKKSDFNELIKAKEITLRKPRLIPVYKLGDEMALTSVLLASLRLVKEFKESILSEAKMQKGGTLYVYSEVEFKEFPDSRIDGLILIVKAGTIRDAAIIEVKNGKSDLEKSQLERYQQIAKHHAIPTFITISNQFVSDSTQSPITIKNVRNVEMFHFSWTYLLTLAHVLLFNKDLSIKDEDQVEIMREVVNYLEWDKSGVFGVNQMKAGWVDTVDKINAGANIKVNDDNVYDAVLSWQQEERDMALILSRELGVLVNSGETKYKGKLEERLKSDCKTLVTSKQLSSTLKVKDAASDIKINSLFEKRTVEMVISLKPPADRTYKGQIGWVKKQFSICAKKAEPLFNSLVKEVYLEVLIKNSSASERFPINDFDNIIESLKNKEIREFKIIYLKDFGKRFSSPKKFVEMIEDMLKNYYKGIVQHITKWEPQAPKMKNEQEETDNEDFIDAVNSDEVVNEQSVIDNNSLSPPEVNISAESIVKDDTA